jgi:hypothetical protein
LNNNNRGNNRRRGRGNNRPNGGGGQQLNRIDSRARGNAPQLLEKYRKLAQDAHLNGDRVQAEYYLQFADHYFRVIADTRTRQEEQRSRPQGERWQDNPDEGEDNGEFSGDADFPSFDQPSYNRPPRDDRPRAPRQAPEERFDAGEDAARGNRDDAEPAAEENPFEPAENPFVRENQGSRGLRPRRERDDRRPRRAAEPRAAEDEPAGLDPASLPPAISAARDGAESDDAEAKPRRGRPRKKPSADDAGETLESVS